MSTDPLTEAPNGPDPHVQRGYAILGDGERGAVIGGRRPGRLVVCTSVGLAVGRRPHRIPGGWASEGDGMFARLTGPSSAAVELARARVAPLWTSL